MGNIKGRASALPQTVDKPMHRKNADKSSDTKLKTDK